MIARNDIIGRNWVFTLNNYSEQDCESIQSISADSDVSKMFVGKEVGDEGTPHLQGYISFENNTTRDHVERLLGGRAWINKAHGGWRQNYDYCTKQNDILVCKGGPVSSLTTKVSDEALEDMKKLDPIAFEQKYPAIWFWHRSKVLDTMYDWAMRNASVWDGELQNKNFWIWGKPGIGKSSWVNKWFKISEQYRKNLNKWWCGYNLVTHKCVVIEDIDPTRAQILTPFMKIWGDRYPFVGELKGGSCEVLPGKFFLIVTSNYSIEECFPMAEDQEAIKRRFKSINMTRENKSLVDLLSPDRDLLQ